METKGDSDNSNFINFINEERTEFITKLNDSLSNEEGSIIGSETWEILKGDLSDDLQLTEFSDVESLEKSPYTRNEENLSASLTFNRNDFTGKFSVKACRDSDGLAINKVTVSSQITLTNDYEDSGKNSFTSKSSSVEIKSSQKVGSKPKTRSKKPTEFCELCKQGFMSSERKRIHMLKAHQIKLQISCALCDEKFVVKGEMIKHVGEVHKSEGGIYSCNKCNKSYSSYRSICLHMKNHKSVPLDKSENDSSEDSSQDKDRLEVKHEKIFVCETCGKRFAFICLLKDHTNLHTGEKPYSCPRCTKKFSQKASLKQHVRTHSGIRPHKCPECPQGFFGKGDLQKHLRLHTGERPYICEMCGDSFCQSSHLVVHRRTHTGERPFQCDICSRGFTKRADVFRHRRIHTGEFPYKCKVCDKVFRQSAQCNNHIKKHHPENS